MVWNSPADTSTTPFSPATLVGTALSVTDPVPSSPSTFQPHVQASPVRVAATLCTPPAEMETTPAMPVTRTGVCWSPAVPVPSWPYPFHPQDQTVPSALSARL